MSPVETRADTSCEDGGLDGFADEVISALFHQFRIEIGISFAEYHDRQTCCRRGRLQPDEKFAAVESRSFEIDQKQSAAVPFADPAHRGRGVRRLRHAIRAMLPQLSSDV